MFKAYSTFASHLHSCVFPFTYQAVSQFLPHYPQIPQKEGRWCMRLTQAFWGLVQNVKLEVHPKLEGKCQGI